MLLLGTLFQPTLYINGNAREAAMTRTRRARNETDGVARTIVRLHHTKYADGNGPKNLIGAARAVWRMENGLPVKDNSKKDKEKRIRSDVESISGSMQRLGKIKYNMHVMSKAMSISSSKLIDEGMKA